MPIIETSVIIATDNRPEALDECLDSLLCQTLLPDEVIVAHTGKNGHTLEVCRKNKYERLNLRYLNVGPIGSAGQRNAGAEKAKGNILFFLDDDIICERDFIREIELVFNDDSNHEVGGASGIITNATYTSLSKVNSFLFKFSLKRSERRKEYAGMLVGPAVNFWPNNIPGCRREVQWLPSGCSAYRKRVFDSYKFNDNFQGYSFMEDVELSGRVAKKYKLLNTTKARLYHKDLGGKTHKSWVKIGRMQVLNRWYIMTRVMGKRNAEDKIRFFYYQIYCIITEMKLLLKRSDCKNTLLRWIGRLSGLASLFRKDV